MIINKKDNVEINLDNGHKYALCDIPKDGLVIKFGECIGKAKEDIKKGDHIHSHNLQTMLDQTKEYVYTPNFHNLENDGKEYFFYGYEREDGSVGIRNEIWIVNTVGCVNKISEKLSNLTGAKHFPHPFGCSQIGEDQEITRKILAGLVNHPNAGGVLVLGLGCENSNIDILKGYLGDINEKRVKFLNCQDFEDEVSEGVKLINELKEYASSFERVKLPVSKLKVGLKCGGSDGFSGITANPLVGRFAEKLIAHGGSCALTEVPEMFGAEHLLMNRCETKEVFDKTVKLINDYKEYFLSHGQVVYENPSPGNKAGGITNLEEKSLGCIQKGGLATVVDVLNYGDKLEKNGLNLLNGPGNDMIAVTNLTAAGVHLILFTTGRGTPLGGPVPTVKIATNAKLAGKKTNWIDFDSSKTLEGEPLTQELFDYVIEVANGKETKNEINGFSEISIFKDGVIM